MGVWGFAVTSHAEIASLDHSLMQRQPAVIQKLIVQLRSVRLNINEYAVT